jgi:hypothetical protein
VAASRQGERTTPSSDAGADAIAVVKGKENTASPIESGGDFRTHATARMRPAVRVGAN